MDQDPSNPNSTQDSSAAANGGTTSSKDDKADNNAFTSSFPPGFRFVPTDDELVNCLMKKVNNEPLPPNPIREVHLYAKDPSKLIVETKKTYKSPELEETVGYFFTPRDKKYPKGSRPNRATPKGYWKPTGIDKAIPHGSQNPVGFKKTLDFYLGKHPGGTKTDWKMHEYRVTAGYIKSQVKDKPRDQMTLDDWVLCKIYKKQRKGGEDEPNDGGNRTPTVRGVQNNEAAGNSNQFKDQNPCACQPNVDVSQCNNGAFLMAGNNDIDVSEYPNSNDSSRQAVNGASLMAGNNNQFLDQNPNACQPTVDDNGASLMAGNNKIVASEYQNSNAFQQAVNKASLMAENNTNASSQQAVNGASLMPGKSNILGSEYQGSNASSRQAVNGASLVTGKNKIIGSEYRDSIASSRHAANAAYLMAANNKIVTSEYQYSNASSSQHAVTGASLMAGNYNILGSRYHYSNASSSRQAVNGASLMDGNCSIFGSKYQYSNIHSRQAVNGGSSMAGNNNIVSDYQNWRASEQDVNGASLMAGKYNTVRSEYQYSNASSRQAVNGAPIIRSAYQYSHPNASFRQAVNEAPISRSEYQYSNASQQAVNEARSNEAYLVAGNKNTVFQDQNSNATHQQQNHNEASSMAAFENQNYPNASQPTVTATRYNNEAEALMAANSQIEGQKFDASPPTLDHQGSMLHDEAPDGSYESYFIYRQPFLRDQIEDLSPILDDIDPFFFDRSK